MKWRWRIKWMFNMMHSNKIWSEREIKCVSLHTHWSCSEKKNLMCFIAQTILPVFRELKWKVVHCTPIDRVRRKVVHCTSPALVSPETSNDGANHRPFPSTPTCVTQCTVPLHISRCTLYTVHWTLHMSITKHFKHCKATLDVKLNT